MILFWILLGMGVTAAMAALAYLEDKLGWDDLFPEADR